MNCSIRNLAERLAGELQTNQRAELTVSPFISFPFPSLSRTTFMIIVMGCKAAIRALEVSENLERTLEIRTDSKYTIKCTFLFLFLSFFKRSS